MTPWINLLVNDLGTSSSFYTTVADSPIRDKLLVAPISSSSAGTIAKHLGFWDSWKEYAQDPTLSSVPAEQRALVLSEFLCELSAGGRRKDKKKTVSCSSMISALVFISSKSGCDSLGDTLLNPLIVAFKTNPDLIWDRKECLPLPLAAVVAFEARICDAATPQWEVLVIGGFLVCLWGGVRWSEVQRCSPSSLVIDGHAIRGVAWRTKVAKSGQPFGFWSLGASGRPPNMGWAHRWILSLNSWIQTVRSSSDPNLVIDYLTPAVKNGDCICRPMPYISALRRFRNFLSAPWMSAFIGHDVVPSSYSLHLKATITSWAVQCQLSEGLRADLAHHRLSGGRGSVRLYSRDDVFGALEGQIRIITRMAEGWRPMTPQARGGQSPLAEPHVDLEDPAVDWEAPVFPPMPLRGIDCKCSPLLSIQFGPANNRTLADNIAPLVIAVPPAAGMLAAKVRRIDSLVVDTAAEVDSDPEAPLIAEAPLDFTSFCFVANSLSGIAHMAGVTDGPAPKASPLPWRDGTIFIRALCGAQLPSAPGCCSVYTSFPAGFDYCRRLGCIQGAGCISINGTLSGVPLTP